MGGIIISSTVTTAEEPHSELQEGVAGHTDVSGSQQYTQRSEESEPKEGAVGDVTVSRPATLVAVVMYLALLKGDGQVTVGEVLVPTHRGGRGQ